MIILKAVWVGRGDNEMFALIIVLQGKQNGKKTKKKEENKN